jgi:hypothetical protein
MVCYTCEGVAERIAEHHMLSGNGVAVQKNRENERLQQLQGGLGKLEIDGVRLEYQVGRQSIAKRHTHAVWRCFGARSRASRTTESKTAYGWRICTKGGPPIRLNVLA